MVTAVSERYTFDLSGGRLCLDFANTVSNRGSEEPVDHLRTYGDLLAFAQQTGAASATIARELAKRAGTHTAAAGDALATAIDVREALYRMFAAIAAGRRPRPADLTILNEQLPIAFARGRIAPAGERFALDVEASGDDLASLVAPIVKSAVDLLSSEDIGRVRACAAETCEWLFIDTTKNHTRRWCDMKVCGNREKVRRFRDRTG